MLTLTPNLFFYISDNIPVKVIMKLVVVLYKLKLNRRSDHLICTWKQTFLKLIWFTIKIGMLILYIKTQMLGSLWPWIIGWFGKMKERKKRFGWKSFSANEMTSYLETFWYCERRIRKVLPPSSWGLPGTA